MKSDLSKGISNLSITRIRKGEAEIVNEGIVAEAPLEIRLSHVSKTKATSQQLAITMRTPGDDISLVKGFLFSEGIISNVSDIEEIIRIEPNVIELQLSQTCTFDLSLIDRRLLMSSSCGICGKSNLEAVGYESKNLPWSSKVKIDQKTLLTLPGIMNDRQLLFKRTGGLHASALFKADGTLIDIREDVGRHNAMDKLIGAHIEANISKCLILVSGRTSFEICQKSAMIGIPVLASIGPPSSLAIEVAEQEGITLIGFLKEDSFNIYTCAERIIMN